MGFLSYIKTCILASVLFIGNQMVAQTPLELTLNKTVSKAIENNWSVKKMEAKLGMDKASLMQANAAFLPGVNLSETFINTTDPLNVFGFKLKQEIVTLQDFNPSLLNDPDDITNFTTKIQVEQPILNFDAITGRSAAKSNVKASELNLQWTKNLIALKAKSLYFNLILANKQKEVLKTSKKALDEALTVTQNFYAEKLLQKVDLLEMQLRINEIESHILATTTQIENVNAQLVHFLGLPETTQIIATEEIQAFSKIKLTNSETEISTTRSDLQALEFQLKASNRMLNAAKFNFLPRLNAFGSYEWNDKNAFGTNANNYLIGAKLEWNIFKGGKNWGGLQKMQHQKNMMQLTYDEKLSDSKRALAQVKNQLTVVQKQVELSQLATAQAQEAYRLKSDRYQEGLEKTADVLHAESVLFSKKINELKTINQYQQLKFNLELLLEK